MRAIAVCTLILSSPAAGRLFADDAYLKSAWEVPTVANASPALSPRPDIPVQTSTAGFENLELRQAPNVAANDDVPAADPTTAQTVSADTATYVHMSTDPALSAPGPALPATPSSIATSQINPAPASTAALPTSAAQTSSSVPYNVPPANAPAPAPAQPAAPVPPAANPVIAVIASTTTTPAVPPAPGLTGDDYISVRWVETWIGGTSRTWVPETTTIHFESRTPGPLPGSGRIGLGTIKGEVGRTKTIYAGAAATQAAGWMRGVAAAVGVGVVGLVA